METRTLLMDTAERMLADHCDKPLLDRAEQGEFPADLFAVIREAGFQQMGMSASGLALADALAVLKVAGRHALPVPLAEILLANRWLNADDRFVSVGPGDAERAVGVPWGREAALVISLGTDGRAYLLEDLEVTEAVNLAGEPRDSVVAGRSEPLDMTEDGLLLMALSRAVLMAGGLERALDLSLSYVTEREQFGRAIARFQAVQHHLAVMAAEVAAAIRAADAGLAGIGTSRAEAEVAAAKVRIGEAVGVVAELAQQLHGAMGYTHEHQLHHGTRRLWAWRDEYGSETHWQQRLGRRLAGLVAASGPDALWEFVATRG